ncbi:MAG: hypothetical protein NC048_00805 [Bacteroides sp.]|nr:hypothetical protein [Bacteroides sp.]MCM1085642.1 hypothetical protein [Bacteroides sp.]MCM1532045.1 hypothetical protein [Ruminococcus flavefaciens]MCM1554020.1 hypothetical protein [Bacteroides sp.]
MNVLAQLGNVPVDSGSLAALYPEISGRNQKLSGLERSRQVLRLKRGLYVVHPEVSGKALSTELIANRLYGPSYVSMHYALRYYGLIPEAVHTVQSLTVKHSRAFETPVAYFDYLSCPRDYFPVGIRHEVRDGYSFVIATPEKALCDLIAYTPRLNLRYRKQILAYLEEDLRFDMEAFARMNADIFRQCARTGKKKTAMNLLAQILER